MERIVDVRESEKQRAIEWLFSELEKGRKSGEEKGWLTLEEVRKNLGLEDA